MASHIKHTRRQMTAAADARNSLLSRKSAEKEASALNRERLIRELLRATEWRSKSGVGAFPRVSGQDVVPDELLHYYLTPFPDGTFPSVLDLVTRHMEPTPEPELEPVDSLEIQPLSDPEPLPEFEPENESELDPVVELGTPIVKTEEDDAVMNDSDDVAPQDQDEDVEMHPPMETPSETATATATAEATPDPLPFASEPTSPLVQVHTSTQPIQLPVQPSVQVPPIITQLPSELAALPSGTIAEPIEEPNPNQEPTPARPKFDPSRPLHTQPPLAPPPPDERLPTIATLKDLMFSTSSSTTELEPTINPSALSIRQSPTTPTAKTNPSPKSLTNPYTASLPPLPPLPADLARKVAGVKVRRQRVQQTNGVNWGGNGIWTGQPQQPQQAGASGLGPGGAGAQGWWASVSVGQAPAPGQTHAPQPGMELLRWQAILQINPAHVFARRPTKCVTTHEWRVLRHELEYTRAMQRIEQLKQDGMWSFRQPKKQRGPALPKTHWDYLMDEMKWLQIDYREERRWKTAVAFEIAHAVREWHEATPEERKEMCVGFRKVDHQMDEEGGEEEGDDVEMDEGKGAAEGERVEKDVEMDEQTGSDGKAVELRSEPENEDDPEEGQEPHTGGMDPQDNVMGADDDVVVVEEATSPEKENEGDQEPGVLPDDDVPGALTKEEPADPPSNELSPTKDPDLPDDDADGEDDPSLLAKTALRPDAEGAEATLADLEYIDSVREELVQLATAPSLMTSFALPPLPIPTSTKTKPDSIDALAELFPDLSLYTGLSDLIDEDPAKQEKRPDESMTSVASGKLAHASRLMDIKPVLVGALDPARHLFKNRWIGLDEVPAVEDSKDVGTVRQDTLFTGNYLFAADRKPEEKALRRRPDSGMTHPVPAHVPLPPRDTQARVERVTWTPEDDQLLKSICDAYPNSWTLTADLFNSSRVTIKPDVRTAWDCYDRYNKMFGGGTAGGEDKPQGQGPVEIALPSPGGTVRKDSKPQMLDNKGKKVFENKKQVRQHYLYDTLRKVVRKRENANKANQPPKRTIPPPHETHSQLSSGQRIYTPAELSKLKAERDARHYAEMIKRRQEIYQQAVAAGRPVPRMPPGLVNIPIRNAQMNAHVQMQLQQQQAQVQAQQSQTQQSPPNQQAQPQVAQTQPQTPALPPVQPQAQTPQPTPGQPQVQATGFVQRPQLVQSSQQQMSPPNGQAQPPRTQPQQQAMSHLLRQQMHMMPGTGIQNGMFVNRAQMGPEQMNQLLLQQAARALQNQQQTTAATQPQISAQPQLQVPGIQPNPTVAPTASPTPAAAGDGDVTMQ
ncbi:chromatin modification-related protein VID21 [Rhizoctonia solani AG-1 IB]|uniref:Vacuolar import and degradation protein 21 n=1 Tax=Thanatephorus cucumeris (strain AG1-IB / isolate 7/3/14) TaxID=1108050 RepID=A0A0B7F7M3_THACB|nr:chromatin modification-related protein VID21 [Rhizoctonia solani AG-1 IB]